MSKEYAKTMFKGVGAKCSQKAGENNRLMVEVTEDGKLKMNVHYMNESGEFAYGYQKISVNIPASEVDVLIKDLAIAKTTLEKVAKVTKTTTAKKVVDVVKLADGTEVPVTPELASALQMFLAGTTKGKGKKGSK